MFTTLTVHVATLAVAILLGSATPLLAMLDRFELENVCAPIALIVEDVDREEKAMGLTKRAIITTVRSRLRAARLYQIRIGPYLYVNVNVVGSAFSARVAFNKVLFDPISELKFPTQTWGKSVTGQGKDADLILSWIGQSTDMFIDEYLRVNAGDRRAARSSGSLRECLIRYWV